MKVIKKWSIVLPGMFCLVLLVCMTGPALAFTDIDTGEGAVQDGAAKMAAGLGLAAVPDYEGSDDYKAAPLLLFQSHYESGRYVDLFGNRMRVNLLPNAKFHLGPVLQYRAARDDVDDKVVDRMKDVDAAIEAGIFAGFALKHWIASVQAVTDISNEHDGTLLTLSGGYHYMANADLTLVPTLSATYADSDYMKTYFGVNASNVGSSGLQSFDADSGFKDVSLALIADYHPWDKWKVVGGLVFKKLLNDAKDSPVVKDRGDDSQVIIGVMAAYSW